MKVGKPAGVVFLTIPLTLIFSFGAFAQSDNASDRAKQRTAAVIEYWTPAKRAAAQPRDMVIDSRGLAYMKGRNGVLTPYGHSIAANNAVTPAKGKPSNGDSTPPDISGMDPTAGATIGGSKTFSATITDASGIKSASFDVRPLGGATSSFTPTSSGDNYSVGLSGFTDGSWQWRVTARDNGSKGGNQATSAWVDFTVSTGGSGGGGGGGGGGTGDDVIVNERWAAPENDPDLIRSAAGRLFYEMPNVRGNRIRGWSGYVCSGTVVTDGTNGRSVIVTAAHCVYDDVAKRFARNVLFIPNQDQTSGSGTDSNCSNDPLGCWVADFGVVDVDWTTATFPDNIPYDYAYYVVESTGGLADEQLDEAVTPMDISFASPQPGARTYGLGYSYSDDPFFMHCAEDMDGTSQAPDNWWLPSCGLSGGSSGGPWIQSPDASLGKGPVMSVNSWGFQGSPGMAGPRLNGTTASCLFDLAKGGSPTSLADGEAGIVGC